MTTITKTHHFWYSHEKILLRVLKRNKHPFTVNNTRSDVIRSKEGQHEILNVMFRTKEVPYVKHSHKKRILKSKFQRFLVIISLFLPKEADLPTSHNLVSHTLRSHLSACDIVDNNNRGSCLIMSLKGQYV